MNILTSLTKFSGGKRPALFMSKLKEKWRELNLYLFGGNVLAVFVF